MNSKIFKQTDSRWSSLPYPTKKSTFGGNGCGCVSCVHIAIEQSAKKNWTPKTLRPYMVKKGYAVAGKGTTWDGITATLKYIGHKTVVKVWDSDPMDKAWKELDKGNRIGIILFNNSRGADGTLWTASGHYIAFTNYKVEGGKHWFYCKDSGTRNHSGWYAYETSMMGCIPKLWIVKRLVPKKTESTEIHDKICAKAKAIADSGKYKYVYYDAKYGHECAICHPHDGKNKGWQCIGYAIACWHHAGVKCRCKCDVFTNQIYEKMLYEVTAKEALKIAQDRLNVKSLKIIRNKKCIDPSKIQKGDLVIYFKGKKYVHTTLGVENHKLADCTSSRTPNIKYGVKPYTKWTPKLIIRYTGK